MDPIEPMRFVVPLDGTPHASQALSFAEALARPPAEILLVDVLIPPRAERGLLGNVTTDADAVLRRETRTALATLEAEADRIRVDAPGVAVETVAVAGDPVTEIVAVAGARRADCIVVARSDHGIVGRLALGSVSDGLIKSAAVPVLIVRPRDAVAGLAPATIGRVVVPLDGSDSAARSLPVAERLAGRAGLPIHLVVVLNGHRSDIDPRIFREREALEARGARVSLKALTGDAAHAIEQATEPDDLLVMASSHGTGVAARLHHGVADALIARGRCPVLVVRGNDGNGR